MTLRKLINKEHQPWQLSYKMLMEAKPSWVKQGMPYLFSAFIRLIEKSSSEDGFHLDIGCGNGVKTVNYAVEGFKTIGIDILDNGFKEARELIRELRVQRKCKVIKANCLQLPFGNQTANSASDVLCFTHLRLKDQKKYKSELIRVLKDGAYILMVLFSDQDKHFHGHTVSKKYTFLYDPTSPLMEGYAHYHGMYNVHFNKKDIGKTFRDRFEIIEMVKVKHPLYHHRYLWNVILRKPAENGQSQIS